MLERISCPVLMMHGRDDQGFPPSISTRLAADIRQAVAEAGGHATLVRAPAAVRASVDPFQPEPGPLAALTKRVKQSFDPKGVLNPGRMWASV